MKKYLAALFLALLLVACGDSPQQLFDTAELEMLQNNMTHAEQLYREIIDKHPDSPFAARARQRIDEIDKRQRG